MSTEPTIPPALAELLSGVGRNLQGVTDAGTAAAEALKALAEARQSSDSPQSKTLPMNRAARRAAARRAK